MAEQDTTEQQPKARMMPLLFWLSVLLVIVGMFNAMPGIPGIWDRTDSGMGKIPGGRDLFLNALKSFVIRAAFGLKPVKIIVIK